MSNKQSQTDVIVKIAFHIDKKISVFKLEYNNREFSTRGNDEIFVQRIYGHIRIKFISNIAEWS